MLCEIPQLQINAILKEYSISGLKWESRTFEGAAHTKNDWQKRLAIPLRFLLDENKKTPLN